MTRTKTPKIKTSKDVNNKKHCLSCFAFRLVNHVFSCLICLAKTLNMNLASPENSNSYRLNPNWKTLVLISINLVALEIKMNVGSIMGKVCLLTKNARAISKISISRYGTKDMLFNLAIDGSQLIAEGGSNGCLLRIQDITTTVEISDQNKVTKCPSHKIDFGIFATECRIDSAFNQATPILAFRLSNLSLRLNDTWEPTLSINFNELGARFVRIC